MPGERVQKACWRSAHPPHCPGPRDACLGVGMGDIDLALESCPKFPASILKDSFLLFSPTPGCHAKPSRRWVRKHQPLWGWPREPITGPRAQNVEKRLKVLQTPSLHQEQASVLDDHVSQDRWCRGSGISRIRAQGTVWGLIGKRPDEWVATLVLRCLAVFAQPLLLSLVPSQKDGWNHSYSAPLTTQIDGKE